MSAAERRRLLLNHGDEEVHAAVEAAIVEVLADDLVHFQGELALAPQRIVPPEVLTQRAYELRLVPLDAPIEEAVRQGAQSLATDALRALEQRRLIRLVPREGKPAWQLASANEPAIAESRNATAEAVTREQALRVADDLLKKAGTLDPLDPARPQLLNEFLAALTPLSPIERANALHEGAKVFRYKVGDAERELAKLAAQQALAPVLAPFDSWLGELCDAITGQRRQPSEAEVLLPLRDLASALVKADPLAREIGEGLALDRLKRLGLPDRRSRELLDAAMEAAVKAASEATGGRPTIDITDQLPVVVDAALDALRRLNAVEPTVFDADGTLARVRLDRRSPRIEAFSSDAMMDVLSRAATWVKTTKAGEVDVWPPRAVCNVVLDQPRYEGVWPVRSLRSAPFFTSAGRLVSTPGYHRDAATYLATSLQLPPVSEAPSPDEVNSARLWLLEPFCDFEFADDAASLAHCVALLLLPFAREFIGLTPVHVITGPDHGIGKDLITEVASLVATGKLPSPLSGTGRDEDELRKLATSVLRAGLPFGIFSNVSDRVDSRVLAATLTAEGVSDRLLGGNQIVDPLNRCIWVLTGVNLEFSAEMARRSIAIHIDPQTAEPHRRRNWRHSPLVEWVRENRPTLVWACLTVISHWLARGRPLYEDQVLGSFESWCQIMGGILRAAEIKGFLENVDTFSGSADAETVEWERFITVWWHQHATASVSAGTLVDDAVAGMPGVAGAGGHQSQVTKLSQRLLPSKIGKVFKILDKDGALLHVRIERRDDVRDVGYRRRAGYGLAAVEPPREENAP